MDDEWLDAIITAALWGPPTLFGVKAFLKRPFRLGRRVVSRRMSWIAGAVWLAPLPLTLVMIWAVIYIRHPRAREVYAIVNNFTITGLRLLSFLCFLGGGMVAFSGSRPEEVVKPKGKARTKKKPRTRSR